MVTVYKGRSTSKEHPTSTKGVNTMSKSKGTTGSQNGFRVIKEPGCIELPRQRAQVQAKMFQFMKTKKGGRRK